MKLNLGCGGDYKEGYINVDNLKNLKADVYHDLDVYPYPFEDNSFTEVYMRMILEHVYNPNRCLKEVVRIAKNGATLTIILPHAFTYSNVTDMQHKTNFTENSFCDTLLEEYDLKELKLKEVKFLYEVNKWKRFIPFKKYLKIFFVGIYDDMLFRFEVVK